MKIVLPFIILFLFSACSSEPNVVDYIDTPSEGKTKEIFIVSHGWHTGFVIPAKAIQKQLPSLKERFANTPYMEFGWGDA